MEPTAPNLDFTVAAVEVVSAAATPTLSFHLHLVTDGQPAIHSVLLRCQFQIESTRRHYTSSEQEQLSDQFGQPQEWDRTLRSILWTHVTANVPGFTGTTRFALPVPCTYDFNLAAVKYFDAVEDGDVPLCLLFSGTIFYSSSSGALQAAQIPWDKQARYRLPIRVWRNMMNAYYPHTAWLDLPKDVFDRLLAYKRHSGLPTWEQAIAQLLDQASKEELVYVARLA